ncbi:uncharacterized protein LOC132057547 [Lycium ferocissimum]|uniref:uncharacterized protein LOC132057547 n=1 Tax=Lycium ferocissimum TaxID=112874 RepID=UPI002814A6A6|nr:uncharacterized protein LOC132057547 [Lycium ferocissimum]
MVELTKIINRLNNREFFVSVEYAKSNSADIGYSGNCFTWCNERKEDKIIWKRLDRMVVNEKWNELFSNNEIVHLPRNDFLEVIRRNWKSETTGNIFWLIQQKMKNTSKALSTWSRNSIGDIFAKEKELGELIDNLEEKYMNALTQDDRMHLHKAKADFILHLKHVESYWRQKANIKWQLEGDENTKFFHSVVRGRTSALQINMIQKDGIWIQGDREIGLAAAEYYQNLFTKDNITKGLS